MKNPRMLRLLIREISHMSPLKIPTTRIRSYTKYLLTKIKSWKIKSITISSLGSKNTASKACKNVALTVDSIMGSKSKLETLPIKILEFTIIQIQTGMVGTLSK